MRAYRAISLFFAATFAAVGLVFLAAPGLVRAFVDAFATVTGGAGMPAADVESGLFRSLAAAYMYLVTFVAWRMFRRPSEPVWPALLAHAKLASAAASFVLFAAHRPYGVYLANGIVDGAIGAVALVLRRQALSRRARPAAHRPQAGQASRLPGDRAGGDGVNLRLALVERWLPGLIRRRLLGRLASLSGDAFGLAPPDLSRCPHDEAVSRFARFTREAAERALAAGPAESARVRARLQEAARDQAAVVRRWLGVRTADEAMRTLRVLYGTIGIDIDRTAAEGDLVVTRCAFSSVYTPTVCALVSALDDGIVDGLSGGGRLLFTARITEGSPHCRAAISGGLFP